MRLKGLDVSRAWAILGMMLVNYKIVFTTGDENNILSHGISLLEGRAAAVFLVLAGIGFGLMSRSKKNVGKTIIKRALFLFVLGAILYVVFEWHADILHYYGIYMILTVPLLYLDSKKIIGLMISVLIGSLILQLTLDYQLGWDDSFNYYKDFYSIGGFIRNTMFNGYHPVFPWIVFIWVGLLIGRLDFSDIKRVKKVIKYSFIIAIIIENLSLVTTYLLKDELILYLFDMKPMNPSIGYVIAGSAWAICFILIHVLYIDHGKGYWLSEQLMNTGQMALTHYVFHSAGVLTICYALGLMKTYNVLFAVILSIVVFLVMMVYSNIRKKKHTRGHLEAFMRKVAS